MECKLRSLASSRTVSMETRLLSVFMPSVEAVVTLKESLREQRQRDDSHQFAEQFGASNSATTQVAVEIRSQADSPFRICHPLLRGVPEFVIRGNGPDIDRRTRTLRAFNRDDHQLGVSSRRFEHLLRVGSVCTSATMGKLVLGDQSAGF